jgi:hypothetical protein
MVRQGGIEVKVEVNFILRGTVHPVRRASPTPSARDVLLADLEFLWLRWRICTAAKLVAAMDRQPEAQAADAADPLHQDAPNPWHLFPRHRRNND